MTYTAQTPNEVGLGGGEPRVDQDTMYNKDDFVWYKRALDVSHRASCDHSGEPAKFPCRVVSEFWDDPNGPYTYNHSFIYQQVVKCDHCGSEKTVWPEAPE